MSDKSIDDDGFCEAYFKRYYECLRINIHVFGKERGVDMCGYLKDIINNSECKNSDCSLNKNMNDYIDKMAEIIDSKYKK